ncbi:MAG: hypothetical protein M3439_05465, partial [Chloroflexota bacterium]|nr:hypothetical protein [Chloroflexota bacterium]
TYVQASSSLNSEIDQSLEQQALISAEALDNAIQNAAQDTLLLTTNEFLFSQSVGIGTKQDFLNKHDGVWGYGDLAVFDNDGTLFGGTAENYTDQTTEAYWSQVVTLPPGKVFSPTSPSMLARANWPSRSPRRPTTRPASCAASSACSGQPTTCRRL